MSSLKDLNLIRQADLQIYLDYITYGPGILESDNSLNLSPSSSLYR